LQIWDWSGGLEMTWGKMIQTALNRLNQAIFASYGVHPASQHNPETQSIHYSFGLCDLSICVNEQQHP